MPATVVTWSRSPAYGAIALASMTGFELAVELDEKGRGSRETLRLDGGAALQGTAAILRFIARSGGAAAEHLLGTGPIGMHEVDEWLAFSSSLEAGPQFDSICAAVDAQLALRSYLSGHDLTVADLAVWTTLTNNMQFDKVLKQGKLPHLNRWYAHIGAAPAVAEAFAKYDWRKGGRGTRETSSRAAEVIGRSKGEGGTFDIDLPGARPGHVVTRFPPEPSGYLHIGHAKAALLNDILAKIYDGRMLVRFDDTNPSKEKDEFVDNILKDIQILGLTFDKVTYTSDYFPQLLDLGERMIRAGLMYADDTPVEQMREGRLALQASPCRNRTVEENLRLFEEMKKGTAEGAANCMRVKMDPANANGCLRDPVAFRCNPTPHHRTGTKYKVYPTYDFACPFVDAFEGVTHALRSSEYKDRETQFYWMLKLEQQVWPSLPDVVIYDYARLSFVHTVLSKRKLQWFVDKGVVQGWTDPRFPTVQGMIRRGLTPHALREFMISQGVSKNTTLQEWDKIWAINRRVIDPVAPRHTVIESRRVPLILSNGPTTVEVVTVPKHNKNPDVGKKASYRSSRVWIEDADAVLLSPNEEVTLMAWGNCIIREIVKHPDGHIEALKGDLNLAGDFKSTKLKLTWLADVVELVPVVMKEFGYLLTKKKIEEDERFEDFVNKNSVTTTEGLGDPNMRNLNKGDIIQLERKAFFIVEQAMGVAGQGIVLHRIPDGKQG